MKGDWLSINALSEMTGVDRLTVRRRLAGLKSRNRGSKGTLFDPKQALPRLFGWGSDVETGADGVPPKAISEAIREAAEARIATAKADLLTGKAVDADRMGAAWESIIVTVRQKLISLPSKMASRFAESMSATEWEKVLEQEVREALEELSKPPAYDPELAARGLLEQEPEKGQEE